MSAAARKALAAWRDRWRECFGVGDEALAAWIFIDPRHVEEVSAWMEEHDYPPMREFEGHEFLSVEQVARMAAALPHAVFVKFQNAGETVIVPASWVHAVLNIRPNMKVAVEVVDPKDLLLYALNQRMSTKWVGAGAARDYTATNVRVLEAIKDCSASMGR
ncbi:MAG: hypothetical protein J3K34DRAFT_426826 [Monoraphidium minutum]|nr:MAG: hypothetical protein J3K34DRAFT_426826 [Monoraphidium minutum]